MEGSLRSLHENEDNFINFVLSFIFIPMDCIVLSGEDCGMIIIWNLQILTLKKDLDENCNVY